MSNALSRMSGLVLLVVMILLLGSLIPIAGTAGQNRIAGDDHGHNAPDARSRTPCATRAPDPSSRAWYQDWPLMNITDPSQTEVNFTTSEDFDCGGGLGYIIEGNVGDGALRLNHSRDYGRISGSDMEITCMAVNQNGLVLGALSPSGCVFVHNPSSDTIEFLNSNQSIFPGSVVSTMAIDGDGTVFCGIRGFAVVMAIAPDLMSVTEAMNYSYTGETSITHLTTDHNGTVYGGTGPHGGFFHFNRYSSDSFFERPAGIPENFIVTDSTWDDHGTLYLSTGKGNAVSTYQSRIYYLDPWEHNISMLDELMVNVGNIDAITALAFSSSGDIFGGTALPAQIFKFRQNSGTLTDLKNFGPINDSRFKAVTSLEMGFDEQTLFGSLKARLGGEGTVFSFKIYSGDLTGIDVFEMPYTNVGAVTEVIVNPGFASIYGGTNDGGFMFRMYPVGIWVSPILNISESVLPTHLGWGGTSDDSADVILLFKEGENETDVLEKDWNIVVSTRGFDIPVEMANTRWIQIAVGIFSNNPMDNLSPSVEYLYLDIERPPDVEVHLDSLDRTMTPNGRTDHVMYINSTGYGLVPDLRVEVPLPAGTTLGDATPPEDGIVGNVASWSFSDMRGPFSLRISMAIKGDGSLPESAQIAFSFMANYTDAYGRFMSEVTSNICTMLVVLPHPELNLTGSSGLFTLGDTLYYNVSVENSGKGVANSSTLRLDLPDSLEITGMTEGYCQEFHEGSPLVSGDEFYEYLWAIGNISSSDPFRASVVAVVSNDSLDAVAFNVMATLDYRIDPEENILSIVSDHLPLTIRRPDITVEVQSINDVLGPSEIFMYRLQVKNALSGSASVNISIREPEHCSPGSSDSPWFVNATGEWSYFIFDAPGNMDTRTLDLAYTVDPGTPDMTLISSMIDITVTLSNGQILREFTLQPENVTVHSPEASVSVSFDRYSIHSLETDSMHIEVMNRGNGSIEILQMVLEIPDCVDPTVRSTDLGVTKVVSDGMWMFTFEDLNIGPNSSKTYIVDMTGTDSIINNTLIRIRTVMNVLDVNRAIFSSQSVNQSVRGYTHPLPGDEAFSILSFDPHDGAANVPRSTSISIHFNHNIDEGSMKTSSIVVVPSSVVFHMVIDGNVLTIIFNSELEYGTSYTVTVTDNFADVYGNTLDSGRSQTFTTEMEKTSTGPGSASTILIVLAAILLLLLVLTIAAFFILRKRKKDSQFSSSTDAEEAEIEYRPSKGISKDDVKVISGSRASGDTTKSIKGRDLKELDTPETPLQIPASTGRTAVKSPPRTVRKPSSSGSIPTRGPRSTETPDSAEVFEYMPMETAMPAETVSVDAGADEMSAAVTEDDRDLSGYFKDVPESMKPPITQEMTTPQQPSARPKKNLLQLPPAVSLEVDSDGRSKQYNIEEILMMTKDGMLIQHFTQGTATTVDEDILASMLTAVQTFIKDTFDEDRGELNDISFGKFRIVMSRGDYITIACVATGKETHKIKKQLERAIHDIEMKYAEILETWDGDMESVEPMNNDMKAIIAGKYDFDIQDE